MKQKNYFTQLLVAIVAFFPMCIKAQTKNDTIQTTTVDTLNNKSTQKIVLIEQVPAYPGGETALFEYLKENVKYSNEDRIKGIQGMVYTQFVIDKDGSVVDIKTVFGIGGNCDKEVANAIAAMPKWKPATQQGKPVKVKYTLPENFTITEGVTGKIVHPTFVGDVGYLIEYINTHLKYPSEVIFDGVKGTVVVTFVVTKKGKIKNAKVVQSLSKDCDEEALMLINGMPNWIAGTENGKKANRGYSLAINFN